MSLICAVIFITDSDSEYFTIKFYHGGKVEKNNYPTGAINYFHKCDAANMSLIKLSKMANELGYKKPFDFYYKNNYNQLQHVSSNDYIYGASLVCLKGARLLEVFLHLPNVGTIRNLAQTDSTEEATMSTKKIGYKKNKHIIHKRSVCHAIGHNIKTRLLPNDFVDVESSTTKTQRSVGTKKLLGNAVIDVDSYSTKPQRPIAMKKPRTRQQLRQYFGK